MMENFSNIFFIESWQMEDNLTISKKTRNKNCFRVSFKVANILADD